MVVGDTAPQKKRQPGGQLDVAYAIDSVRCHIRRVSFDAEQELWTNQYSFKRPAYSLFEPSIAMTSLVEAEQRLEIFICDRPPISAAP